MPTDAADRYWQSLGEENPFWGVGTNDALQTNNLTADAVHQLYASGEAYIAFVWQVIHRHLDAHFAPTSALDFGCGVGRLAIPLGRRCRQVVGVDVSEGMLRRARARCDLAGLAHVGFVPDAGPLAGITESFDVVHSYIVFQHIPCPKGEAIAERLVQRLKDGGVGVLHFTYFKEPRSRRPRLRRLVEGMGLYPFVRVARGIGQRLLHLVPV